MVINYLIIDKMVTNYLTNSLYKKRERENPHISPKLSLSHSCTYYSQVTTDLSIEGSPTIKSPMNVDFLL